MCHTKIIRCNPVGDGRARVSPVWLSGACSRALWCLGGGGLPSCLVGA